MADSNSQSAPGGKSTSPPEPIGGTKPYFTGPPRWRDGLILGALWLLVVGFDRLWLWKDVAPPAWDQGEHLTRALNYWRVLQQPDWLSPDWWTTLWRQSPGYRAPLVYLATVPLFTLLGRGFDQAVVVNLLFAGVLMGLLYGLGCLLFDRQTGLWAAGLSLLVPSFYALRLDYLLDLGLVTCVTAAWACLTQWRRAGVAGRWLWALGLGLCTGLVILAKPTGILFLVVPVLWIAVESLTTRPRWQHILQWGLAAVAAWLVCGPWIQTNWLTILTNSQSNNASWVAPELVPGDPWSALSYYARMVPRMVTYSFLVAGAGAGCVGLLLTPNPTPEARGTTGVKWSWLLTFLLGSYAVLTLLQNKDPRHMAPAVPILVLVLARGLTWLTGVAGRGLRWALAGLMAVLMVATVLPGSPLPPSRLARPLYPGPPWPTPAVVDTLVEADPYLRSTLGVVPNTPQINPLTLDFYGAMQDFRAFGREIGFNPEFVPLDARALTWVLTKTGDQGPTSDAKTALSQLVEQGADMEVAQTWPLPDGSTLSLHHRQPPPVVVSPVTQGVSSVALVAVTIPETAAPGQTVPVTYDLLGPWDALRHGLLVLSWQPVNEPGPKTGWIHDHGIGLGQLFAGQERIPADTRFEVTETLGMVLPEALPPGVYQLKAEYVDRRTGEGQSLTIPTPTLRIAADIVPQVAPEPELVGVLHQLSQGLATGNLDPIFATVGRINQYDPIQDYLLQAEAAMTHRLGSQPDQPAWLYTKVMAQVLRQDAGGAIATLNQLTTVAPDNVYHWLYLGFVHIYAWQPRQADVALAKAAQLNPTLPELKVLQGAAALQQLNLWQAWRRVQESGLLG
ncbi:MAG: glycosyltransferase family 39 protein [Nodosilinea sp.]